MSKNIKLEIQGLRAIAVLAVIFYHAEIKINEIILNTVEKFETKN